MDESVEVERTEKDGVIVFSVRMVSGDETSDLGHFQTLEEAVRAAKPEADRLNLKVRFAGFR